MPTGAAIGVRRLQSAVLLSVVAVATSTLASAWIIATFLRIIFSRERGRSTREQNHDERHARASSYFLIWLFLLFPYVLICAFKYERKNKQLRKRAFSCLIANVELCCRTQKFGLARKQYEFELNGNLSQLSTQRRKRCKKKQFVSRYFVYLSAFPLGTNVWRVFV